MSDNNNNNKLEWFIERASAALRALSLSLVAKEAMEFIDCMRNGGSFEECYGIYRTIPFPSPSCPFFRDLLSKLPVKERRKALLHIKYVLEERINEINKELR